MNILFFLSLFFLIIIFPAKHEFQLLISLFFSFFRQIWCTKYHKFLITHVTNICIELGEQHFAESKSLPFFLERCYLIETIKNIRLPWLYILAIIWKLAIKHSHKKIYNISFSQTCNIFSFFLLSFAFSLPLPPSHFLSLSLRLHVNVNGKGVRVIEKRGEKKVWVKNMIKIR